MKYVFFDKHKCNYLLFTVSTVGMTNGEWVYDFDTSYVDEVQLATKFNSADDACTWAAENFYSEVINNTALIILEVN